MRQSRNLSRRLGIEDPSKAHHATGLNPDGPGERLAAVAEPATTRSTQEFLTTEVLGQVLHTLPYPEAEVNRRLGLVASQLGG
jgi:hypothetical protein